MHNQSKRKARQQPLSNRKSNSASDGKQTGRRDVKQPRQIHPLSVVGRVREDVFRAGQYAVTQQILAIFQV